MDKVTDGTKKAELQKRLDLVSNAIAAKEAEAQAAAAAQGQVAVTNADGTVTYTQPAGGGYVAPAQTGGGYVAPTTPPANTQAGDPMAWDSQAQSDQNGQWSHDAGQPGAWDDF